MRDIITKLEELNVEKPQLNEGLGELAHEAEKDHGHHDHLQQADEDVTERLQPHNARSGDQTHHRAEHEADKDSQQQVRLEIPVRPRVLPDGLWFAHVITLQSLKIQFVDSSQRRRASPCDERISLPG